MNYVFHPYAKQELELAVDYYTEHGGKELAHDFLSEIYRVAQMALNNRHGGARIDDLRRRYVIKRFPYSIIYREIPKGIRILAIEHHKRHPAYWRDRK